MDEMMAACGLDCETCDIRLVPTDPDAAQRVVAWFHEMQWLEEDEDVAEIIECEMYCKGCRSDGPITDQECQARPCAMGRGLESCADCDDFPCKKLRPLMASRDGMMIFCQPATASITKEEYALCMRQFDSMPNLVRRTLETGKLPSWIGEHFDPTP